MNWSLFPEARFAIGLTEPYFTNTSLICGHLNHILAYFKSDCLAGSFNSQAIICDGILRQKKPLTNGVFQTEESGYCVQRASFQGHTEKAEDGKYPPTV